MLKRIVFIMAFLILMAGASFSADGDFDSIFDGDGVAVYDGDSTATMGYAVALQQDRKIVVTGSIAGKLSIFRYNNDGILDNTFDGDGIVTYGGYGFGYGVAIQPDGKIVIVGESDWDAVILRYNSDGTLDSSFGEGDGIVTYDIGTDDIAFFAVALQTDGKIVVAGYADYPEYKTLISRYNSDGILDNTFGSDGVVTYQNNYYENGHDCGVAIQTDGKIVVATGYAFAGYSSDILVLRYNSDGTPDVTFSGDGIIRYDGAATETDYGHAVVIQPNGKIVVVGETYNGTNFDVIILRYNNDGALDSTFSGDGIATYDSGNYDYGRAVAVQANGKILVVGSNFNPNTSKGNILILRYDGNGILDDKFSDDGVLKYNSGISDFYEGNAVVEQPDCKIVVTGGVWNYGDVLTLRLVSPVCTPPSSLTAKPTSLSSIVLGWRDKSNIEEGFKIERKEGSCDSANTWKQIAKKGANVTTHTNSGLAPNTTYSYRVRAYNADGDSAYSNCASAKTALSGSPKAPTNLKASSVSSSKVNLSWKDNSGDETEFKIYRKAGAGSWSPHAPMGANIVSFTDTIAYGNTATTTYSYYVKACNSSGCSPATNYAVVSYKPTNLTATASSSSKINLKWTDKSNNETGFQIYRKTGICSSTNSWSRTKTTGPNITSYNNTGLTSGTTYSYKVRAYKKSSAMPYAYGYSAYSNCKSATTP